MQLHINTDRIWMENEQRQELAYVTFPSLGDGLVEITHTVVDPSLRGHGVAGTLLLALADELRRSGRRAVPTCSYAAKWFAAHPTQRDVLSASAAPHGAGTT